MTTTMEEQNAPLRAAVAERLANTPADDHRRAGYVTEPLPERKRDEVLQQNQHATLGYDTETMRKAKEHMDALAEHYAEWTPPAYARQTGNGDLYNEFLRLNEDEPRQTGDGVPGPAAAGTTAKFGTGAVRSDTFEEFRYDLVSPIGLREVARACAEGAAKYGDWNWEKGMPVHDLLNHAIAHIYGFLSGDRSEPHLGHAAWNLLAAIHSYELWPQLNDGHMRGDRCCAPVEVEGQA